MMAHVTHRELIPALTHGVVLVRSARAAAARGVLIGFHGYAETAALQMERLEGIPGSERWTVASIEGLHRFYRGRSQDIVASWMTRQDREIAIADNLAYVDAALDQVPHDGATRIVYAGFSQGVAMAFRAAMAGRDRAAGIIAVGGDVPPELLQDPSLEFPAVLLVRGARDEWLTEAQFEADRTALSGRAAALTTATHQGGHEWNADVAAAAGRFLESIGGAERSHRRKGEREQ